MCLNKVVKMIDTIRLVFDVKKPPQSFNFITSKNGVIKGFINPTKEMKASGKYYPRITYLKRPTPNGNQQQILVEFSIPKLLYGNNFDEVTDTDFDAILDTLCRALHEMGILFRFPATVAGYKVVKIDYSKNIIFEDGTTVSQILRLLNLANIKRAMDISTSEFRNGGQICHLHTNQRDIAFYDKIADLKQSKTSEKRSEEKDNRCQLSLLDWLQSKRNLAVLRFEIRLNGVKEIRANLARTGIETDNLTFRQMFSSEISQKILLYWWNQILSAIPKAPLDDRTIEQVFLGLLRNKDATPQRVLATLGMYALSNSPNFDARFAKEVFDHRFANGSWARSNKLVLTPEIPHNLRHLLQIQEAIQRMQPTKLKDYQDLL